MQFQPLEDIAEDFEHNHPLPAHLLHRLLATAPAAGAFGRRLSQLRRKNSCVSEASTTYSCLCQDTPAIDCSCGPSGQRLPINSIHFTSEGEGEPNQDATDQATDTHHNLSEASGDGLSDPAQDLLDHESAVNNSQDTVTLVDMSAPATVDASSQPLIEHRPSDAPLFPNLKETSGKGPSTASYPPWLQSPIEEEIGA